MKILLVAPIRPLNRKIFIAPPIGLGYLAAQLKKKHRVRILDYAREHADFSDFYNFIKEYKPEAVGFSFFANNAYSIKKQAGIVKAINPSVFTIAGGPQPSAMPVEVLTDFPDIDFAFKGEAEMGLPLLLKALADRRTDKEMNGELQKIPGLIWRKRKEIICNQPEFIAELDSLGQPSWDLLELNKYPAGYHGLYAKRFPVAPIITSRGCPHMCSFCGASLIMGKKIRRHSVDYVVEGIELLYDKFNIREIHIEDDSFTSDKDFVMNLCEHILQKDFDLTFSCPNGVRIDTLDQKELILMKRAGWYLLALGIESGSERVLKMMKKGIELGHVKEKIRLIKKTGLKAHGLFMLGYPGETEEDMRNTIDFAAGSGLDSVTYNIFSPLPGTKIFNKLYRENKLDRSMLWELYSDSNVIYSSNLSRDRLKTLYKKAFLKFYIRPSKILNFISLLRINSLQLNYRRIKYVLTR